MKQIIITTNNSLENLQYTVNRILSEHIEDPNPTVEFFSLNPAGYVLNGEIKSNCAFRPESYDAGAVKMRMAPFNKNDLDTYDIRTGMGEYELKRFGVFIVYNTDSPKYVQSA